MNQNMTELNQTLEDTIQKYVIQSMFGFQVVLWFGLGRKLGIFDYLLTKAKEAKNIAGNMASSITFTLEELVQELALDTNYLEGWLLMALVMGIFSHDKKQKHGLKTTPYIVELFINPNHKLYSGEYLGLFYTMAHLQEKITTNFKTGETINHQSIPAENRISEHKLSARLGKKHIQLFADNFPVQAKKLRKGGRLLEVGCGFGFNLENWAKAYPTARIVGIDIDSEAIEYMKKKMDEKKEERKLVILFTDLKTHLEHNKGKYDVILLHHVLHEMDQSENYRQQVFAGLYQLLSKEGVIIVGEPMIPGLDTPMQPQFDVILHKWYETSFGSKFYDEKGFRELVQHIPFSQVELVQAPTPHRHYFWVLKK
jgi:2-polyprenyl-3-methyl-5-hydroxy-6-metoxy-1,4-benzoquinol methylase